ncbi:MAG TPA: hypothetical protein VI160_03115 [Gemmatimonadales bacterium]
MPGLRSALIALIAGGSWFVAGPAAQPLQVAAICRHQQMAHHGIPGAPCYCDQMTGGSTVAAADVAALSPAAPVLRIGASTVVDAPSRFSVPASPSFPPEPPPPNPLA